MPKKGRWEYQCHVCGMKFRTPLAEARHRHNFPALCKRNKQFAAHMAKYFPPKQETDHETDRPTEKGSS